MNWIRAGAAAALLCGFLSPAAADTLLTINVHSDTSHGDQGAAKDVDQTRRVWIGAGKIRSEAGDMAVILRQDQQKLYVLDLKDKTKSTLNLPVDLTKQAAAEARLMFEQIGKMLDLEVRVLPTDETRKIRNWNTRKHTVEMVNEMGLEVDMTIWATTDIPIDRELHRQFLVAMQSMLPGGALHAADLGEIDGVWVDTELTQSRRGTVVHRREELVSAEVKPAPPGIYDIPADFAEEPFNPLGKRK